MSQRLFNPNVVGRKKADPSPRQESLERVEVDVEAVKACIERLKTTGARFDQALIKYQELLQQQDQKGGEIESLEEIHQTEVEVAQLKTRMTKLLWAVTKYLSSSAIVATTAASGTFSVTGDPVLAALTGVGGALGGAAIEARLNRMEVEEDKSEDYYKEHPETAEFMEAQEREKQEKEGVIKKRLLTIEDLRREYALLEEQIVKLEEDIDELSSSHFAMFKNEPGEVEETEMSREEVEKAVRRLAEKLQTVSGYFDQLLERYYLISQEVSRKEASQEFHLQLVEKRELAIRNKVLAHRALEVGRKAFMSAGTGSIFAIGAWQAAMRFGFDPVSAAVSGGSFGVAAHNFIIERMERFGIYENRPRDVYDHRARLERNFGFKRFKDVDLAVNKAWADEAGRLAEELRQEQQSLSDEMDAFMNAHPIK